jgi:hypothetical protein
MYAARLGLVCVMHRIWRVLPVRMLRCFDAHSVTNAETYHGFIELSYGVIHTCKDRMVVRI